MKKFLKRSTLATACLFGVVALSGCSLQKDRVVDTENVPPEKEAPLDRVVSDVVRDESPKWQKMSNELFDIEVPESWKEAPSVANANGSGCLGGKCVESKTKTFEYSGTDGDYFRIVVDIEDVGIGPVDQAWQWRVNDSGDGVTITDIDEEGTSTEYYSSKGDGKLEMNARHTFSSPEKPIRGHTYIFFFGNSVKEDDVDTEVFKKIFETFRAKSADSSM